MTTYKADSLQDIADAFRTQAEIAHRTSLDKSRPHRHRLIAEGEFIAWNMAVNFLLNTEIVPCEKRIPAMPNEQL